MDIRVLTIEETGEAARVLRASFDERLPWLSGLHTPAEDLAFFREKLFCECQLYGAFEGDRLVGIIAFREGWVDQLYMLPDAQRRGVGRALLAVAMATYPDLSLWTFQRNQGARRFYERLGFVAVETTDGSSNEEGEPDVRYRWRRAREIDARCKASPDAVVRHFESNRPLSTAPQAAFGVASR